MGGSTLIVETTNYSPKSSLLGSAETLHVVERFTRTALDRISYEITLTDPHDVGDALDGCGSPQTDRRQNV